ncbi:uncharacterized protein SCHCODRAFT_02692283 [Schizophyllum commune H4-8]|uniref:Uncharacterized protein n=1 Tax=Schizophyllum commune (strain H4-8 / FGSC 9210) TaxID=578458 RepID=D8QFF0_SCHCM|nr:uncharacterized protein SCHCODRAFT_02692283 [Schizophyllum commune H4-8]KAI5887618.1 hypothetical protein SCHCODRAFT_02692283 [Schizophyllum commune H4-8]
MARHPVVIPRFRPLWRCFINDLPNEVLEMILVSSVPMFLSAPTPGSVKETVKYMKRAGVRDYPSLLALVCRHWRPVARTSQALYAFLFVDVEDAYDFKQTDEYYTAFLARSGSRPLTLSVNGMQDTTIDLLAAAPFRDHLPRLRWTCIDLYASELLGNYDDPTGFDVFPLFPGVQTPLLETVHVDVGQDGSLATDDGATEYFHNYYYAKASRQDERILRCAPRLRSFSMYRYDPKGLPPMLLQNVGLDYQTLTCLRLPYVALGAAEWLKVLAELPVLRVFHGSLPRDESDDESGSSDESEQSDGEEEQLPEGDDAGGGGEKVEESGGEDETSEADADKDAADGEGGESNSDVGAHDEDDRPPAAPQAAVRAEPPKASQLTLSHLSDLHLVTEYESDAAQLIAGLTLPSLSAFGLATDTAISPLDASTKNIRVYLLAGLKALIRRSGCEVHDLTLDTPRTGLASVIAFLRLVPELRSLHLNASMVAIQENLLDRLADRAEGGELNLVPKVAHLVIDNREPDLFHPEGSVPLASVLGLIDKRWPMGWTTWEIASLRVVVSEDVKNFADDCAEDGKVLAPSIKKSRKKLRAIRARGDIDLVIESRGE